MKRHETWGKDQTDLVRLDVESNSIQILPTMLNQTRTKVSLPKDVPFQKTVEVVQVAHQTLCLPLQYNDTKNTWF